MRNSVRIFKVLERANALVLIILILMGFFGNLLFLDTTNTNILLNDYKNYDFAKING